MYYVVVVLFVFVCIECFFGGDWKKFLFGGLFGDYFYCCCVYVVEVYFYFGGFECGVCGFVYGFVYVMLYVCEGV